jgi:hypothetical protein
MQPKWTNCDTCGEVVKDDVKEWDKHNKENYVKHVFLSHPEEEAKRIIQKYVNRKG